MIPKPSAFSLQPSAFSAASVISIALSNGTFRVVAI
jgi:hypothetical protein